MCFSSDSHAKRIAQLLAEAVGRRRPRYFVVRAWGRLAQIRASGVLVKSARTHRIHHRRHARWPTNTAAAFDARLRRKLVASCAKTAPRKKWRSEGQTRISTIRNDGLP